VSEADFRVVIPARYASTRFPGKPLIPLAGRPMIAHVYERAHASGAAEVIIATDDERIAVVAREIGAEVVMTRADHVSGTERVAEVARLRDWSDETIVLNVQGDSPLIPPASISQAAALLMEHPSAAVATLCTPIVEARDYTNRNVVKVVTDRSGRALYFSRAGIPCRAHGAAEGLPLAWRHLGIYAYRVAALDRLSEAPACMIETVEKLEQLRALWLGMEVRVGVAALAHGPDVDAPEDVAVVEAALLSERGPAASPHYS
jgi:3-deoxy-manno-octulosonate cytidylyltransferase (CMP-KDO synthetase)